MTRTSVPTPVPLQRTGGWLLIASLPAFVLVPVVNVAVLSGAGIGPFSDITRDQMNQLGNQWALVVLTVLLAMVIGNAGVSVVALTLRDPRGGPRGARQPVLAAAAAVLAVAGGVVDAVLRIAAAGFDGARLGDDGLFRAAELASNVAFSASAAAIVLLAAAFSVTGIHRTTGTVVGALGTVVLLVSVVAYAFVPPFVLALLWLPLGVVWLLGTQRRGGVSL
ncbi:hypothetical protein SAMN06264364_12440 [Quadrisphaera granulorum]|uniref:DUF4386 family protein n=1 Tax=Quadrisphaera granulorum TaxID=317664 RepID=A0A315ZZJ5_9ACTN|nr:hypothetical protein [Quadrisphaera granulorum]PWJ49874.1 hypothetical protein BXY45_12440 [Quadrisphaera granulorum]SZE98082.1 hypothetical protein SAMN06264364_12440 [Quadrisphaera granulorum]